MRKRNKKADNKQTNINYNVEIDYDKLAKCITNAIIESKSEEKKLIENEEKELNINWHKTIGLKEHGVNENIFKRICISISNAFHIFKTFIFYKKDYAQNPRMAFGFMVMILLAIFGILRLMFFLLSVAIIYLLATGTVSKLFLIFLLYTLFFERLMRIIGLEIDQMEDKEMINMIFSSLMAFIAALFATISFICTVIH